MERITANDALATSAELVTHNIAKLHELFPEAFTEGEIDFGVLKQLLGGEVDEREERYGLNWHGKRHARQLALTPSAGTLRPCPDESVDWDTTQNLMIEGDNLEVLKLLQRSYSGKIQLISIDPPYNTGKDFVYPDNFKSSINHYLKITGQIESDVQVSSNSDSSGRYHTDWLTMMSPRIRAAHRLLSQEGVMFITIGDQECPRLRLLMDEVFGEENFIATIAWQKKQSPQNDAINMSDMHDNVVVYAKNARSNRNQPDGWQIVKLVREASQESRYRNTDADPRGPWTSGDLTCNKTSDERPNLYFPIRNPHTDQDVYPKKTRVWGYEKRVVENLLDENRIFWGEDGQNVPRLKIFRDEVDDGVVPSTWWTREFAGDNQEGRRELRELFPGDDVFDTPKPTKLLRRFIEIGIRNDEDAIALDFFAGSGTFGDSCYQINSDRDAPVRFILVQLPEQIKSEKFDNLADVTKERLRRCAKRIVDRMPDRSSDLGFRVFKLDSSNIDAWEPDRDNLHATIEKYVDNIKCDRSDEDVLYELLLKLGLDLCVPIDERSIVGKTVHCMGAGTLFVCLDNSVRRDDAEPIALGIAQWHQELNPTGDTTIVFRDSGFADDVTKTNLTAILNQHGLRTVRSL